MYELFFYSVYVFVTFMFGTIFSLLFLDIPFTRKNVTALCIFSCCSFFFQWLLGYQFSYYTLITFYPLVVHLPLLLFLVYYFKCSFVTSVSSIFMSYFLTSPRFVMGRLIVFLFPAIPYPNISGRIVASFIMSLIICLIILKPIKIALKRPQEDVALFFYPLTAIYITSYIISTYTDLLKSDPHLVLEIIYTLFFSFILYYVQKYFVAFDEKLKIENEQQFIKVATDAISSQINSLTASNEQTRILRHDIRHFCTIITQFANEKNIDKIIEYANEINVSVNDLSPKIYCRNFVVNSILVSYLERFNQILCPITTKINIPEDTFVTNTDLCIILANALENAYHSCGKSKNPFLDIKIDTNDNRIFINICNTCQSDLTFVDGLPSTNTPGHGYGTKSIALVTGKYNGLFDFALENQVFSLKVILHNHLEE